MSLPLLTSCLLSLLLLPLPVLLTVGDYYRRRACPTSMLCCVLPCPHPLSLCTILVLTASLLCVGARASNISAAATVLTAV
jgi:hypothetical protein